MGGKITVAALALLFLLLLAFVMGKSLEEPYQISYRESSGWTRWSRELNISGDGNYTFAEHAGVAGGGREVLLAGKLDNATLQELTGLLVQNNPFFYGERYSCGFVEELWWGCGWDAPDERLTVRVGAIKKRITFYKPTGVPEGLARIKGKMREISQNVRDSD